MFCVHLVDHGAAPLFLDPASCLRCPCLRACSSCRHAADLADNRVLRAGLEAFARAGGVVYAECGGLIYLSKSIQPSPDDAAIPMG